MDLDSIKAPCRSEESLLLFGLLHPDFNALESGRRNMTAWPGAGNGLAGFGRGHWVKIHESRQVITSTKNTLDMAYGREVALG